MAEAPRDLSLLQFLEGRVRPASEHFAEPGNTSAAPTPARRKTAAPLTDLIPHAERLTRGARSCVRIETRVPADGRRTREGYLCPTEGFPEGFTPDAMTLLGRDRAWADVDPETIAFIDTETTGLSGGSGTVCFLVGVGRFRGGEFVVHQYFMEDYSEEEALIDCLADDLRGGAALAGYNSRGFDLPLLVNRWRMVRRRPEFPALHLDLLYPARRLWRMRCADCSLATIERDILGVRRFSDVEGWLIPGIYFDYLRGLRPERLLPVVDHHAQDIISLGALAHRLAWLIGRPDDPALTDAGEHWGLARLLHAAGRNDEALAALERGALAARDEDFGFRLAMHLAREYKRRGRWEEAVAIWRARADQARPDRLDPLIALAKYYEHKAKNYGEALSWTERAIALTPSAGADSKALNHRRSRLLQKLPSSSV